ncbi:hypothetical protein M4D51_06465 [Microbacterium sp. p3-SID338]|uniref:hypothetical protein n=1 Tax=unclassified Microbacterium TaxID=2609290 RepID=UPI000C7FE2B7|nr:MULTISPECIES: hypothetical protein [unclassified Microbacterium]MCT1395366.1 hypothetical protein [Microbacterium sp. p3-SID338]PMC04354.1 hypothetical protein CJ226_10220 [Microbacterium sp. UMB0228]
MKEDFLRPPQSVAEYGADAVRVIGILSVLVAAIWSTPTDAGILALALPALMLPRVLGMRGGIDLAIGLIVLIAAASNVFDLYRTLPGWDLVVHFVCTGALAATGYLVLSRLGIVTAQESPAFRPRIPIVLCTVIGLAASAVWEMIEWAGRTFVTDEIFVTYEDTIGDMAMGGLGALAAGVLVAVVRLERHRPA